MRLRRVTAGFGLAGLACAAPALAVDGAREINQVCATSTGCFAGDSAGFPVTINQSGAYRLTSNLVLTGPHDVGISMATSEISIDLNGFEIRGVTECPDGPGCTNTGTGKGIVPTSSFLHGHSVRNGSVSGMGLYGVEIGQHGEVKDVRANHNGGYGIVTGVGSVVMGCAVGRNGQGGISASSESLVADNVVMLTKGSGAGISGGGDAVIRGNSVNNGSGDGIFAAAGSLVTGNTASSNFGDGIEADFASRVSGNVVLFNSGFGLNLPNSGIHKSGYSDNVIDPSTPANTVSGGVDLGGNLCNGIPTCP
jgi:hypothetical protein